MFIEESLQMSATCRKPSFTDVYNLLLYSRYLQSDTVHENLLKGNNSLARGGRFELANMRRFPVPIYIR